MVLARVGNELLGFHRPVQRHQFLSSSGCRLVRGWLKEEGERKTGKILEDARLKGGPRERERQRNEPYARRTKAEGDLTFQGRRIKKNGQAICGVLHRPEEEQQCAHEGRGTDRHDVIKALADELCDYVPMF